VALKDSGWSETNLLSSSPSTSGRGNQRERKKLVDNM